MFKPGGPLNVFHDFNLNMFTFQRSWTAAPTSIISQIMHTAIMYTMDQILSTGEYPSVLHNLLGLG